MKQNQIPGYNYSDVISGVAFTESGNGAVPGERKIPGEVRGVVYRGQLGFFFLFTE